mgnify:CR=1 FL=1
MAEEIMPLTQAAKLYEDEEQLLNLLDKQNPTVPMIVASRRDITQPIMRKLAERRSNVRWRLLEVNADQLPTDVLDLLTSDLNPDVRSGAHSELARRGKQPAPGEQIGQSS